MCFAFMRSSFSGRIIILSFARPVRMECGEETIPVREIKQEAVEEDPDTVQAGDYQVVYLKEEMENDDDSKQDGGSSTESVGNPSFQNWDSGWQLPEEDEGDDSSEVGNASFEKRIQDSNIQLSGDAEEQDNSGATTPKLQISRKRSNQETTGHDKEKVQKTITKTGIRGKSLNNDNSIIRVPKSEPESNTGKICRNLYQCYDCNKIFLSKWERIAHMTSEHFRDQRPFKCPHCYKGFDKEEPLKNHMVTHSDQVSFQCPICTENFSSNYTLKLHVKTHSREKPYQCFECHKRFALKSGLSDHVLANHGSHITVSAAVAKESAGSSSQTGTTKTNFEVKPFKCADCDERYSEKWELIEHIMDTHPGEKPFKCYICNKRYDDGALLGMHTITCHPE